MVIVSYSGWLLRSSSTTTTTTFKRWCIKTVWRRYGVLLFHTTCVTSRRHWHIIIKILTISHQNCLHHCWASFYKRKHHQNISNNSLSVCLSQLCLHVESLSVKIHIYKECVCDKQSHVYRTKNIVYILRSALITVTKCNIYIIYSSTKECTVIYVSLFSSP